MQGNHDRGIVTPHPNARVRPDFDQRMMLGVAPCRVEERLGNPHLPEMIHGHNTLQCTHEATGTTLRFDALHGLQGWVVRPICPSRTSIYHFLTGTAWTARLSLHSTPRPSPHA